MCVSYVLLLVYHIHSSMALYFFSYHGSGFNCTLGICTVFKPIVSLIIIVFGATVLLKEKKDGKSRSQFNALP